MEKGETSFNEMQTVKRRFFAMRNGVISDTLRRAGSPFRIIFGLNLPQLADIAGDTPHNRELAERLWSNTTTRESMLLAPMLIDAETFGIEDARRWINEIPCDEVADVMCIKLLRRTHYAQLLASELAESDRAMSRYTGVRLMFNLVSQHTREALDYGQKMSDDKDARCRAVARQLVEECEYLIKK